MLLEAVYQDRFYITGTFAEVKRRLAEHARSYTTVKELLDALSPSN